MTENNEKKKKKNSRLVFVSNSLAKGYDITRNTYWPSPAITLKPKLCSPLCISEHDCLGAFFKPTKGAVQRPKRPVFPPNCYKSQHRHNSDSVM